MMSKFNLHNGGRNVLPGRHGAVNMRAQARCDKHCHIRCCHQKHINNSRQLYIYEHQDCKNEYLYTEPEIRSPTRLL